MNIVYNDIGKITIVYQRDEVNPVDGIYTPDFLNAISERYRFTTNPNINENTTEAHFERGQLITKDKKIPVYELVIYNDGISILGANTDLAKIVLSDVLQLGAAAIGLRTPKTEPFYAYENTAIVDFDRGVSAVLMIYDGLKRLLDKSLTNVYSHDASTHFLGFGMAVDPTDPSKVSKREFIVVRRIGFPYSGNRFLCIAPLPTSEHHALLQEMEHLLISK